MTRYLLLSLSLLLYACGSNNKNTNPSAEQNPNDSLVETVADTSYAEGEPMAVEIGRNKLHPGRLKINAPFVGDSVLHLIFPGKFESMEGPDGIWWKCQNCERVELFYNYFREPESQGWFPDSSFNTTALWDDDTLELGDKTYRLLTFFHTNETSIEFTVRFMGAPTGLALFRKEKGQFILENFQAVLGCYGSFRTPYSPSVYRAGKDRMLFDFTYGNGGAGGHYTGVKEIFLPENGSFKRVLLDRFVSCSNTDMGEWNSEVITPDSLGETTFSDLVIVTKGWVNGAAINEAEDEDDLYYFDLSSDELKAKAKQAQASKEKFGFTLTRTFHYNGKEYTCVKSETVFSGAKD